MSKLKNLEIDSDILVDGTISGTVMATGSKTSPSHSYSISVDVANPRGLPVQLRAGAQTNADKPVKWSVGLRRVSDNKTLYVRTGDGGDTVNHSAAAIDMDGPVGDSYIWSFSFAPGDPSHPLNGGTGRVFAAVLAALYVRK